MTVRVVLHNPSMASSRCGSFLVGVSCDVDMTAAVARGRDSVSGIAVITIG